MGVKAGSFVIPSSSEFSITGLGFKPRWSLFLFSNQTPATADVWTSGVSAGIGAASMQNTDLNVSGDSNNIRTFGVSETWFGNNVGGTFLGDVACWLRGTTGGNGYALYVNSMDADGWTFRYGTISGNPVNVGAVGCIVYYIAGDENWEQIGSTAPYIPGAPLHELGWQPQAFFGIGHGGGHNGGFGATQTIAFVDISVPSVCAGVYDSPFQAGARAVISQWRGILDPNVNVQEWWGHEAPGSGFAVTILEETQSGGVFLSSQFDPHRTDTASDPDFITGGGFSQGTVRMNCIIFGQTEAVASAFTPNTTVGVPTFVALPFTPEAVILFSPGDYQAGPFDTSIFGATTWGWCTATEQACLSYGGLWNPPTPQQSAVFHSSDISWMGNCVETGVVGSVVSAGSARVVPGGFEHTTEYHNASVMFPIHYWAIGPGGEAPGFFRVIN